MESEEDRPDPHQVRLVKELHREMADRRIVINSKNKKKKKRRNLTVQVTHNLGNTSSSSDCAHTRQDPLRSKSLTRTNPRTSSNQNSPSSDSEISELGEDKKQKAALFLNKNKIAEARVTTTEGKLADFNQRLAQRRDKLEELHQKLKQRKERLLEREEKLREFEKAVLEKEKLIKTKTETLQEKDRKLNEQLAQLGIFETRVNTKETDVAVKEKAAGVKMGDNNAYEKMAAKTVPFPMPVLKPILSTVERRNNKQRPNNEQSKRISWADSAISSQSPSSNSSDDDVAMCNLSVSQRLKRFENRQFL